MRCLRAVAVKNVKIMESSLKFGFYQEVALSHLFHVPAQSVPVMPEDGPWDAAARILIRMMLCRTIHLPIPQSLEMDELKTVGEKDEVKMVTSLSSVTSL
jgi:hypothetical protein